MWPLVACEGLFLGGEPNGELLVEWLGCQHSVAGGKQLGSYGCDPIQAGDD